MGHCNQGTLRESNSNKYKDTAHGEKNKHPNKYSRLWLRPADLLEMKTFSECTIFGSPESTEDNGTVTSLNWAGETQNAHRRQKYWPEDTTSTLGCVSIAKSPKSKECSSLNPLACVIRVLDTPRKGEATNWKHSPRTSSKPYSLGGHRWTIN